MSAEIDQAAQLLRDGVVADVGGLLKAGGRREVEAAVAREAARGLRARVVIAPRGAELGPYHALWERLGLDAQKDLLLLFDGRRWEARGWGLSSASIQKALAASMPSLRQYAGRGLSAAVANLAAVSRGEEPARTSEPAAPGGGFGRVVLGVGATATIGLLGLVIVRRRRLARERSRALTEARSSAEQVFAEVMIALDDLPDADAPALREKASRVHNEIESLAPKGVKLLPAKEDTLTLAKLGQMENELEALRSVVLQRKRRA